MVSFKKLLSNEKKVAGIDIGSSSLKLVEISGSYEDYTMKKLARIPLERGIVENGLLEDPAAFTKTVKALFKTSRCKTKSVVTALPGHSVIIKKATFAAAEEEELYDQIIDEAAEYLPFDDIDNVDFDLHIIGENELNQSQVDVVIAAATKDVIKSYRDAFKKAGCKVVILDIDSFALETAYEENYEFENNDVVVLIHMGASITNINILKGGGSVFTRNILQGGDTITEALKDKLGVSFDSAEVVKLSGVEGRDYTLDELIGYGEPIFQEIERSIDYFVSTSGGLFIKQILLSGGCAKISGIADVLGERLHCETEIFDPFKKINHDKKAFSPDYIKDMAPIAPLGVGLALRRMDDK
ncbi:MAG: type IV pilus assembly protein PilM [Syntrophaceae bacterium]|nr:type IV pilus assembly protein PilM [Syntrophaceae bacterium]